MKMKNQAAEAPVTMPVAIIGMACIFPKAPDLRTFWNNILGSVDAVGEPTEKWDAQRYLDTGRIKTQYGGWLKDLYRFDPREFGIMPNSMDGGEPDQFLALKVAADALADAGYLGLDIDHTDTGIILGHSTYLHRGQVTVIQNNIVIDQTMELIKLAMPHLDADALGALREMMDAKIPPTNSDTSPGLVPNVMTGRIANRLNLRGPNYLVDAACSSSLLAVGSAIDELRAGRSRMMLAGGVNASLPADVSNIFTQLGALSNRGRVRPFEAGSDGTLLGEGLGVIVLKRLEDAIADGDRVYSVIRGVGQSSDGRGAGLLAPSHGGETLAIRRTYEAAGVDPASIDLVEAHGTGIPLGDRTEIASLKSVFGDRTTPMGTKALGSVKSMISHTIPAAGVASLIKMSLAVHHRILPPTLCDTVNPDLGIATTPFFINTQTAPWIGKLGEPRRAAVNAFGFGGTNSHAIVEQAPPEAKKHKKLASWPAELCVLSADSAELLAAQLDRLSAAVQRNPQWRLADVAATLAHHDTEAEHRVALVAKDLPGLAKSIAHVLPRVRDGQSAPRSTRGSVFYGHQRVDGKLAFLFPGEGSQYPAMFADLALHFEPIQAWLDFWHGLYNLPIGHTRTDIVFPTCEIGPEARKELEHRMHAMDVGSESVFIGGMAMHELLVSLGVDPDVMCGHSSGESAALGASGANPAVTPEARANCISQHYEAYEQLLRDGKIPTGALLAVGALPPATVEEHIATAKDVVIAMDNCSNQIVLYGPVESIASVSKSLGELGGMCMPLPFDRGYHTSAFSAASAAFLTYYKNVNIGRPQVPLYSCATADLFPTAPAAVRKLAAAQWSQKVRFRETVMKMHDDGVRLFVEVGPSSNLTSFVNDILIDRDFAAMQTNVRRKNGVEQLMSTLGQLYVAGRGAVLSRLFADRATQDLDFDASPAAPRGVLLDNTMPMVRYTEDDKALIRRLTAPAALPLQAAAQSSAAVPPTESASDNPPVHAAEAGTPGASHGDVQHSDTGEVMAGYFDLMRGFLDQQRTLVENLPAEMVQELPSAQPHEPEPTAQPVDWMQAAQAAPAWPSTHAIESLTPLLDQILEHSATHVLARCHVGLLNDHFIRDHVMSGKVSSVDPELFGLSCVPFTVSLEIMAEACAVLAGHVGVRVIENVKAYDWVALDNGDLSFEVRAEVTDRAAGLYSARVITARGPILTADFRFEAVWSLPGVAPLVEHRESCLNHPNMYATGMFHGPVFQSMEYVQAWDDSGIDVELSDGSLDGFFAVGQTPRLVLNPVLLDAMGQVVACWLVQYVGPAFHAFPSTIERIELYEPCPVDRPGIVMRMRQQPMDGVSTDISAPRVWTFDCTDGEGRVLMRGSGLLNLFFTVPQAYHDVRKDPRNGWFGAPLQLEADASSSLPDDVSLWEVPLMTEDFLKQSGAICLRILAHAVLGPVERDEWRALQGHLKRRREWLFGRAALKEAVRDWVAEHTGELLYPTDIVVRHDDHGAPVIGGWWTDTLIPAPRVSLTHNANACVVAVGAPDRPVGVDVEELGRIRSPQLLIESLADAEKHLAQGLHGEALDERLLRMWCAKEAAAKCFGTGLQGQPAAFVVVAADAGFENLVVQHEIGSVDIRVTRRDRSIIAVAGHEVTSHAVHS